MAFGVNSVLSMGVGALFASQANIQTTGNNISNVNTPGYSRQAVVLNEKYAINYYPGQVGQGVQTQEVIRYFDAFLETNYLQKFGTSQRYESLYSQLRYVEGVFNESNVNGVNNSLSKLFEAWNKLAQTPDQMAAREALLSAANGFTTGVRNADTTLSQLEDQMNAMIGQNVDQANQLIKEIAALNKEISANYQAGRNNPNQLMDQRDYKVRQLAGILDITVDDRGPGSYQVKMKNGTTLVQDEIPFSLEFRGPSVENNLTADSLFKGTNANGSPKTVHFSGSDNHEYTIEMVTEYEDPPGSGTMVTSNDISGTPPAKFKVSIDGGRTWLSNDDGTPKLFNAQEEDGSVRVGELNIWFDAGQVSNGDRFVISPKSDVYWISPTSGPMNISTQVYQDGTDNPNRITGGTLGGYLEFRDYRLAEYRDRLNAFTKSVIWETNRVHSQGAGLTPLSNLTGSYVVGRDNVPMGSPEALFTWSDKLQSGNMSFVVYDNDTGLPVVPYPGHNIFSNLPGGNFDPSKHSLQDVCDAINNTTLTDPSTGLPVLDASSNPIKPFVAEIVDGKLNIRSSDSEKYSFAVTDDSSGLAAALGLNTFFTGDSASTIGIREDLSSNLNLVNAGKVNGAGEINPGDNQNAGDMYNLATKKVSIGTTWSKDTDQTLSNYYSTLVTKVGADTSSVKYTAATETAMALDLYDRQEEISGVNLDEEMSSLIKFQASYKAAAKLITTADEMLQTLLSLKQ